MKDSLDTELAQLEPHDVGDWRREHVRRRAHRVLDGKVHRPGLYHRVFEPTLLVAVCSAQLFWALQQAVMILMR